MQTRWQNAFKLVAMKRKDIPMTFEEYEVFAYPFGWKCEYWDGQARLRPRGMGVTTRLDLTTCDLTPPVTKYPLVPVDPTYTNQMIAGYFEVFADSVEFCDWPIEEIQKSAERCMERYFNGKRGDPLPASVIALAPNTQKLIGLALFVLRAEQRPRLDLLYVRSPFQRQGVATAMVTWGVNHLIESGFHELFSAYHICNPQSKQWHHAFGLEDVHDFYYLRIRLSWLNHEIERKEKVGEPAGLEDLLQEQAQCQAQLEDDPLWSR